MMPTDKWENFYRKGKVYAVQIINKTGGNVYDAEDILQTLAMEIFNSEDKLDKCLSDDGFFYASLKRVNARRFNKFSNPREWSDYIKLKNISETYDIPLVKENAWKLSMIAGDNKRLGIGAVEKLIEIGEAQITEISFESIEEFCGTEGEEGEDGV